MQDMNEYVTKTDNLTKLTYMKYLSRALKYVRKRE